MGICLVEKKINIADFGEVLLIRSMAENIFNDMDEDVDKIIVDFEGVEFMGRSFTQEYYRQRKKTGR